MSSCLKNEVMAGVQPCVCCLATLVEYLAGLAGQCHVCLWAQNYNRGDEMLAEEHPVLVVQIRVESADASVVSKKCSSLNQTYDQQTPF